MIEAARRGLVERGFVADAEGITGMITQVKLKVQPLEEMDVVALACPDSRDMTQRIGQIPGGGLAEKLSLRLSFV